LLAFSTGEIAIRQGCRAVRRPVHATNRPLNRLIPQRGLAVPGFDEVIPCQTF
jgi:hypothetical protein